MENFISPHGRNRPQLKEDRNDCDPNPIWAFCTQLSSESDLEPLDEALLDYIENASPIDSDEIAVAKSLANFHIKMGQQNLVFLESDEAFTDSNTPNLRYNPSFKRNYYRRSSADYNDTANNHANGKIIAQSDKRRNSKKKCRGHHEQATDLVQQSVNKDFIEDGELADVEVGTMSKALVNKKRRNDIQDCMTDRNRISNNNNHTINKAMKLEACSTLHRKAIHKLGHRWGYDSKRAFCEEDSQMSSSNDRQRKMKMMRKTFSKQSTNSASEMEIDYNHDNNSNINNSSGECSSNKASYAVANSKNASRSDKLIELQLENADSKHDALISRTSDTYMSSSSDSDIITSDGDISYYETGVEGDDEQSCCEAAFVKWWQDDHADLRDMRLLANGNKFREMKPGSFAARLSLSRHLMKVRGSHGGKRRKKSFSKPRNKNCESLLESINEKIKRFIIDNSSERLWIENLKRKERNWINQLASLYHLEYFTVKDSKKSCSVLSKTSRTCQPEKVAIDSVIYPSVYKRCKDNGIPDGKRIAGHSSIAGACLVNVDEIAPSPISSTNVGNRMLREMGWTPGTCLGTKDSGIIEPIKISVKNDKKGIGFTRT
ncbi:G patch domain-containing protein 2 [Trichoplax sp. H2]|nr:G patch domain-containing protein 2 [Trichoplax sp. H2]|eukprot:RDD44991.1 G patch domain-containing protein 2 [Trichoplax sp. H2]